jgi:shikimate kinase
VAAPETIVHRLAAESEGTRPLLADRDPTTRIRRLLAERAAGYAAFEQVPTDGRSVADIVDHIVQRLSGPAQPTI